MLYRAIIRDAIVQALLAADTSAGQDVYAPRDWPTTPVELPALIVSIPAETKGNLGGPMGAKFSTTATIVVLGRLTGRDALDAEAQLEVLAGEVTDAVLTDYKTATLIEQFASVDTQSVVTDTGSEQLGELSMAFGCVFSETYQPGAAVPLTSIEGTVTLPGDASVQFAVPLQS